MQASLEKNSARPLPRKAALLLVFALGVIVLVFGYAVGVIQARGHLTLGLDELMRGILGSTCMAWFVLPCGFLHLLSGDRFLHDVPTAFIVFYDSVVVLLLAGFLWSRRWWPFIGATVLLLIGAGGCSGFFSGIHLAK
jgi:hypothetical protein